MTILQVKASATQELMAIPGVVGVGIQKGKIAVYTKKTTKTVLAAIPLSIEGYNVIVIEIGEIFALQARTDKWRPAPGGVSIGHHAITAGTLGTVVIDNVTGRRAILSNNHVLANSDSIQNLRANRGDPIYQPGSFDGGTFPDTIAHLERWIKIDETGTNKIDCAIAMPINDADLSDDVLGIGNITEMTDAIEDMAVQKSGRTTGLTTNTILDVNATVDVGYGDFTARFTDQIMTGNMSSGGDSGSALCTMDNKVVGLLYSGSDTITIHCKIGNVVDSLNIGFGALIPTTHNLKLAKSEYYDYTENFAIARGETKNFDISLEEIPTPKSYINVNSTPTEANIYLDDALIGKTNNSFEIQPGTHTLKLALVDYYDYEESFTIAEDETKTFDIVLEKIPPEYVKDSGIDFTINLMLPLEKAYINVNSIPTGASIYLNGVYIEDTNISNYSVDPGAYALKLTMPGYYDYAEDFTIVGGETKTFNITLTPTTEPPPPPPEEKPSPLLPLLLMGIPFLIPLIKK